MPTARTPDLSPRTPRATRCPRSRPTEAAWPSFPTVAAAAACGWCPRREVRRVRWRPWTSWTGRPGRRTVGASSTRPRERTAELGLWIVSADGGAPVAVPGVRGRSPAWSPASDLIAYFTSARRRPGSGSGSRRAAASPAWTSSDLSTNDGRRLAFSWSGRRLAIGVSPGSGDTEVVVVDLESGQKAQRRPAAARSRGSAGSPGRRTTRGSSTASSSTRAGSCCSTASARR